MVKAANQKLNVKSIIKYKTRDLIFIVLDINALMCEKHMLAVAVSLRTHFANKTCKINNVIPTI